MDFVVEIPKKLLSCVLMVVWKVATVCKGLIADVSGTGYMSVNFQVIITKEGSNIIKMAQSYRAEITSVDKLIK